MANGNSKALEKENAARMQIRKERAIRSNFFWLKFTFCDWVSFELSALLTTMVVFMQFSPKCK